MNIRGLVLEKELIESLHGNKSKLTIDLLKSLDVFDSYNWGTFKKDEFNYILDSLVSLFQDYLFDKKQKFIIFYETDVTEMDVVTVLEINGEPVFMDIEIKNDDNEEEMTQKIREQFAKREESFFPQLFKDSKYIELGIVNNKIVLMKYKNDKSICEIDANELKSLIFYSTNYTEFESFLYQVNNLSSIISISSKIKDGTFKYYKDTQSIADSFIEKINKDPEIKGIVCYGNAGTGKSVLALKLFYEIPNTKILILNPKFYFCLNMSGYWKDGRASYKVDEILSNINSDDILIVDEAQRLEETQIISLARSCKKIILFGDEKQSFKENENIMDISQMKKFLEKLDLGKIHKRKLNVSKRYSDKVSLLISNLTTIHPLEVNSAKDFEINLFYSEKDFEDKYNNIKGLKKIYIPITQQQVGSISINDHSYEIADFMENGFSIETVYENKVGHTLHALSFDVDHSFVFLSNINLVRIKNEKSTKVYYGMYYRDKCDDTTKMIKFMNELNILFSRGRKSLNIYVNDILVYLFLKGRLPKK